MGGAYLFLAALILPHFRFLAKRIVCVVGGRWGGSVSVWIEVIPQGFFSPLRSSIIHPPLTLLSQIMESEVRKMGKTVIKMSPRMGKQCV